MYKASKFFFYTEKAFITEDIENEPPLLEELGFNFDHIRLKTLAVLNPLGTTSSDVNQLLKFN